MKAEAKKAELAGSGAGQAISSSLAISTPEAAVVIREKTPTAGQNEEVPPIDLSKRSRMDGIHRAYVPNWYVMTSDGLSSSAPSPAREIGLELCKGLILLKDRSIYDKVVLEGACTEMTTLLAMSVPWATVVTKRVDEMKAQFKEVEQLKTRAVKAEESLRHAAVELERVTGQASALTAERDALKEKLEAANNRIAWRNDQLRLSRRALRKARKLVDRTEDRVYQMGYDEVVRKAHSLDLDHTLLLEPHMSDSVGREDVDEPVQVSSDEDEGLSDQGS